MAYVRKVRTASDAVAVQVVRKHRGQRTILAHVGSAHTDAQLGILLEQGRRIAAADQGALDIEVAARTQRIDDVADWRAGTLTLSAGVPTGAPVPPGRTTSTCSRLLYDTLGAVYDWLGFDVVGDAVFRDLVIARLAEPTSKADAARVLTDLGTDTLSYKTIQRHLAKVNTGDYRNAIAAKCFIHAADRGGLSLLGFPLEVGCYEGNTAETTTLVPIITAFAARHELGDTPMVIAADAGMLSASNLSALDEAGLGFIVGSRSVKAPIDLASHVDWNGDVFTDGQIIDTVTPRHAKHTVNEPAHRAEPAWNPDQHPRARRVIWAYSANVERSFRMSKSDLRARPMFHRTRDAIEAHLTIVFTALAVAHNIQERSGLAIAKVFKSLRPLHSATIAINGTTETFPPEIPAPQQQILASLAIPKTGALSQMS